MQTPAKEIMSRKVLFVREGDSVEQTVKLLVNNKITGLPVTDAEGRMVGVVSEYDILVQLSSKVDPSPEDFRQPIQFSRTVQAVAEETPLNEVVQLFIESKFRRLPVLDPAKKIVGIITRRDLMRVYYYRTRIL